jgi:hypothetical protein
MSRENVEAVRSFLAPFGGINLAAVDWGSEEVGERLGRAYSAVELRTLASGIGTGVSDSYRGLDGLVRYLREWLAPFGEYHVEWLDYIEAGDWVVVPTRQWGVGNTSGARAELELVHAYKVRDGQIVRLDQYDTVDETLEAAEPSE